MEVNRQKQALTIKTDEMASITIVITLKTAAESPVLDFIEIKNVAVIARKKPITTHAN